ncbi:GNAT family N-acetyltransferase [Lacibacterium aquatile]|uniref:GNAT family N-acetyltransferase n=1 Tax=Lacibacterium aquatile TaxID=1168082 RepID=A0ABW5DN21_9PROT
MDPALVLRPLDAGDLDLICTHRRLMFGESGRPAEVLAAMADPFRAWLTPRLADGSYFGWAIESGGDVVAGLGMMVIDWPPHPSHPTDGRRGYILNVFVDPLHRGRGLAKRLMAEAEAEAERRGLSYLILHATKAGRPLYEGLGWDATSEMAKLLPISR